MGEGLIFDLRLEEARLLALAGLGPTGTVRPVEKIRKRLQEEQAELSAAIAAQDIIGAVEEAGDLAYYGLLLVVNGGMPLEKCRQWLEGVMEQVNDAFRLWNPRLWHTLLFDAATAKYQVRFIENRRRKDKDAERMAIARVLPGKWLDPRIGGHTLRPTRHKVYEAVRVQCAKCGAEWESYVSPRFDTTWRPLNREALYPCPTK